MLPNRAADSATTLRLIALDERNQAVSELDAPDLKAEGR